MDLSQKLLFSTVLIFGLVIYGARGDAMVSGTVFCDQCKDGERSLFDFPVSGSKVTVNCVDSNGQIMMSRQETTNLFGSYGMKFDGTPDLSNCYAQVSSSNGDCGAASGPAQRLKMVFRMFDMEMYAIDSLYTQPAQPMSFCPKSKSPTPNTVPAPVVPIAPVTPVKAPPAFKLPPMPPLAPLPPLPFVEASACSHQNWMKPEYKCYWRLINPDSKVAVVFGPLAAKRYGNDISLWKALQGRGDPYRTLLREGTTALLNSYNSLQFPYHTLDVIAHMNSALMGSQRSVLLTALRFLRANSGNGKMTCKFTPCK